MRAIWNGSLSFGLINIPVRLYSAALDRALSFKLIDKHGNCPISYVKVCRYNHKEVPYDDIVRGYEYEKGDYVVLDEKDFKKAAPEKTGTIDILQFVDKNQIDTKYYAKPYYVEADPKSAKAFVLLRDALRDSGKVGIASFIMKDKEHIATLSPEGEYLILNQLRYQDEFRKPDFEVPKGVKYKEAELKMAEELVKKLSKNFDPKKFHDTYTGKLEKVIEAKAKGKKITLKQEKAVSDTNMKDLMKMLKESLKEKEKHES